MVKVLFSVMLLLSVFFLGWVTSALFFVGNYYDRYGEIPEIHARKTSPLSPITGLFILSPSELESPADRISEKDIKVYDDEVVLSVDHAQWSEFTDTNSMDPLLDVGANTIEVPPKSPEDIYPGDVVSYRLAEGSSIIHRVIAVGTDDQGRYYILKGDNNPVDDGKKVRFNQIEGIVVAVVY